MLYDTIMMDIHYVYIYICPYPRPGVDAKVNDGLGVIMLWGFICGKDT